MPSERDDDESGEHDARDEWIERGRALSGSAEIGVVLDGAAPLAIVGETAPAPVTYKVIVLPRWGEL